MNFVSVVLSNSFLYSLQTSLRNKVNASDITSLIPTSTGDSGEASSLLPKMIELQTKINGLEGVYDFLIGCTVEPELRSPWECRPLGMQAGCS